MSEKVAATVNIRTLSGQTEVPINLSMYLAASDAGMGFSDYVNQLYPTNVAADGTAFQQMMVSSGLILQSNSQYRVQPPTLKEILQGQAQLSGAAVVRPDGKNSTTSPAARLLFPSVMIDTLESVLRDDRTSYSAAILAMVAYTRTIRSPKYEQVIIDHSNSQAARGQPIGQLSRPTRMLTLETSQKTRTMPVYAIGLEISSEAMAAATLDLVALAIREHATEERVAALNRDLKIMADGDVDMDYAGLSAITMASLDPTIVAAGVMTHRAWIKYLRRKWTRRTITDIICDIDTYLAIEGRSGRPTKDTEPATDERLNSVPRIALPGIPDRVSMFTTEDSLLGANMFLGLDRTKSIRRMVYTGAEYKGIEEFVMRKSTAMRMDWSERLERAGYDEAFDKGSLTV